MTHSPYQPYYQQPNYYVPVPTRPTTHPLNWVAITLGAIGTAFIPVPFINNATFILAVGGLICAFISLFLRGQWYWNLLGAVLSIVGIFGTIWMQHHWATELNEILNY